ncbi:MAG TPA: ATP-binding protein [Burkholderiaceae bacterium]|jgi:signal transduction histidine kinase
MDAYLIYYCSLALQAVISPLLAAWLWVKAGRQPGMRALALFCVFIGFWGAGQLAINLGDDAVAQLGKFLVNTGPLNAVFFLHFVLRFLGRWRLRQMIAWYAVAGLMVLAIAATDMGRLVPWLGFKHYYIFPVWGWVPGLFVSASSAWAYLLLLLDWPSAAPKRRGQIAALCLAGVWGSCSTLMFLNPSFGIPIFPYSVILLPGYALLLVFGILRYDLMSVNLWANRLLAWLAVSVVTVAIAGLLLSLVAQTGFAPLAALPFWELWLLGTTMLAITLVLEGPARRAMEKLIFPGAHLEAEVLADWRARLEAAGSWVELETVAVTLLEAHLRQIMAVVIGTDAPKDKPCVHCYRQPGGDAASANWRCDLIAWEGATPTVQRVGEVFGALLAAAAGRLDQLLRYAEQENRRLQQVHLLELGGLAATVAHELRNPLNIISMAAVSCDADTRAEIRTQIERADHLIQDLLSYSGEVRLNCERVNVAELARSVIGAHPADAIEIAVDPGLFVQIDRMRGEQILGNLVNNAIAMLRGRPDPRVRIEGEPAAERMIALRVCDNGPGVHPDLAPDLFQPFKTRRPGGTGLGLAIVRRLTEAHGGRVQLVDRPGWHCCFELHLPIAS